MKIEEKKTGSFSKVRKRVSGAKKMEKIVPARGGEGEGKLQAWSKDERERLRTEARAKEGS